MGIAEAVHVDGLDAHTRTAIATVSGAGAVAGVFFAMAPFVEGVILATHDGQSKCIRREAWKLALACFLVFLHVFRSTGDAWVSSGSTWMSIVVKMVGCFC